MHALPLLAFLALAACGPREMDPAEPQQAPAQPDTTLVDWSRFFDAEGAVGTMVVVDTGSGEVLVHDPERAATRFTPASTSKVFNGLVFLDQGVIRDVDSLAAWDGVQRGMGSWNQDHSLRSATRVSAVWFFQRMAQEVGREGYADVFAREPLGNATMGEPLHMAWLDGSWRVSAFEHAAFMDRLRRGDLAFAPEHQATVREILPVLDEGEGWRLKAKTGWALRDGQPDLGLLVGWVERADGDVVFAMNVEAASANSGWEMRTGRVRLARSILAHLGAMPDAPRD